MTAFTAYYVVVDGPNRERLANDGFMYSGSLTHGSGPQNVKEFKRLGWAKRAAAKVVEDNPWLNNVTVIGLRSDEVLMRDGLVMGLDDNRGWEDRGYGTKVAFVNKPVLLHSLFG